jgi:heme exporter protein B
VTATRATAPPAAAPPRPAAPRFGTVVAALVRKDLRVELRTGESVPAMLLFSVSTFVLFHFGLDRDELAGDLASGVLWVTLLFAAVLGINRLFVAERDEGGFDGFLLAPVDRTALFVAKAAVLLAFLVAVELVAVPAFGVLLLAGAPQVGALVVVLALADLGIAIVGTLVSALAVQTRARDLLGPLLALPLSIPIVIAAARASAPLLDPAASGTLHGRWLLVLGLYDLVFGLIALAVFDFLLED